LLAEMLHVPLGMLGFGAACAAALGLLRWAGSPSPAAQAEPKTTSLRPVWLAALLAAVLGMGLLYTPRPQPALAAPQSAAWSFPAGLRVDPWPLTQGETDWLTGEGAQAAERWHFEWGGRRGSLLIVSSASWRGHHRPERCFEVYGLTIQNSYAHLAAPDFPVRVVSLGKDRNTRIYAAAYWFQSIDTATDDYAARIWADMSPDKQRWLLVTLLFDDGGDPADSNTVTLYTALRGAVQAHLEGRTQP
jgi:exosortase O